jgi:hypothetical protein
LKVTDSIVQEPIGLTGHDVGAVLALIAARRLLVPLKCAVEIIIRVWVEKEVLSHPLSLQFGVFFSNDFSVTYRTRIPSGIRRVVVRDSMSIEELPGVVSVVTGSLQPHRKIIIIETLSYELGIATYKAIH